MGQIVKLEDAEKIIEKYKYRGLKVGLCHGCFDVLHIGHLKHFKEAKTKCDILFVTITPDIYINKGAGHPLFQEGYRLEMLSSVGVVDCVSLNKWPSCVETLRILRPNIFFKGPDYKENIVGNIKQEIDMCNELGIEVYFTNDLTSSSTWIINKLKTI